MKSKIIFISLIIIISKVTTLTLNARDAEVIASFENAKQLIMSVTGEDRNSAEGKKRLEEGIGKLQQTIDNDYSNTESNFLLVLAYDKMRRIYYPGNAKINGAYWKDEKELCSSILEKEPDNYIIRLFYARLLGGEKRRKELRQVLKYDPMNIHALYYLGGSLITVPEKTEEAIEQFRLVVESDEGLLQYGKNIILFMKRNDHEDEALELKQRLRKFRRERIMKRRKQPKRTGKIKKREIRKHIPRRERQINKDGLNSGMMKKKDRK